MSQIDLNVERMTRPALEAAYFDLVSRLERIDELKPNSADEQINRVMFHLKLAKSPSMILSALMSADQLYTVCGSSADSCYLSIIAVQMVRIRRALRPIGVSISTLRGSGYVMPADSITRLKAHLNIEVSA